MQSPFTLDSRLSLCVGFVRADAKLADIGTDHAYLPVKLALEGRVKSAIAADINPEPLSRGRQTIEKYGVQDRVSTRLCNGLEGISPEEVTDIVIAGMGADTIIGIISCAPWLKDKTKRLILQPMTKGERLIKHLYDSGFEITEQKCCIAEGKPYTVMCVEYTGNTTPCTELFTYTGKLHPESREEDREFLRLQVRLLMKRSAADVKYKELAEIITERTDPQ
ncbi:MAG: SAM-dependent methyltransferase [Ruminococcus sp.]|nr:SAM-dependent methyltransferase [Ruminococcus sp.]